MASSVVRPHVPEEELHAYCDGELSPPQRVEIAEHMLGCLICRSQHAEVMEVRARASRMLAIAAPRSIRPPVRPAVADARIRRRLPRLTGAAAAAIIGVGLWFSLQPDTAQDPVGQLAGAAVAPTLIRSNSPAESLARSREQLLLGESATAPSVLPAPASTVTPRLGTAALDVHPVVTQEWKDRTWDDAVVDGHGDPARIPDLKVAGVRVHLTTDHSRPTFMVRQALSDGQPVWVFEGLVDDIAPVVYRLLQTSGFGVSSAARVRSDYVNANGQISRPARMMVVVGRLRADTLNMLAARVR